jgi:hypothetical protein
MLDFSRFPGSDPIAAVSTYLGDDRENGQKSYATYLTFQVEAIEIDAEASENAESGSSLALCQ